MDLLMEKIQPLEFSFGKNDSKKNNCPICQLPPIKGLIKERKWRLLASKMSCTSQTVR